ncbi:MAG TPA: hypothetical protein VNM14_16625 [Planctomycetota bacterium]|nr:hypothetical protein [Planctomycetota bacterium]
MGQQSFDASRDLRTEYRGTTNAGKTVTCVPCGEVVFDLPDEPTVAQRRAEGVRLAAHLEFAHDMVVRLGKCADAGCDLIHIEAFPKVAPGPGTAANPQSGQG